MFSCDVFMYTNLTILIITFRFKLQKKNITRHNYSKTKTKLLFLISFSIDTT